MARAKRRGALWTMVVLAGSLGAILAGVRTTTSRPIPGVLLLSALLCGVILLSFLSYLLLRKALPPVTAAEGHASDVTPVKAQKVYAYSPMSLFFEDKSYEREVYRLTATRARSLLNSPDEITAWAAREFLTQAKAFGYLPDQD